MKRWRVGSMVLCLGLLCCGACDGEGGDDRSDATDDVRDDAPPAEAGVDGRDVVSDAGADLGDAPPDAGDTGSDGGGTLPPGSALFTITQNGTDVTYDWSRGGGHHVRCTPGINSLMIRLAVTTVRDGEDDLHLDIDVFDTDPANGGTYQACAPFESSCTAPYFDVFWHDSTSVFVNGAASTPCALLLTPLSPGGGLHGRFACRHLALPYGSPPNIDVEGDFSCDLPP